MYNEHKQIVVGNLDTTDVDKAQTSCVYKILGNTYIIKKFVTSINSMVNWLLIVSWCTGICNIYVNGAN